MSSPSSAAETTTLWAELRHAEPSDVPFIRRMIYQMAEFERLTHIFSATDSSLLSILFPSPPLPPFFSLTPLALYLSFTSPPVRSSQTLSITQFSIPFPVADPDESDFASPLGDGRCIAGFVICFPNYSTFLPKMGLYIEHIFVREPWRRMGLGKFMLSLVAKKAAELGMGRVDWCVLDWNVNAIEFYKGMGAEVFQEWRICRLTGPSLEKYKDD
ncbi:N-acetyltransferase [Rhynchospora pubera]|uniref:N-acetyltransferase n=1 Tax=Rhynchospora pubera TaxID=906938 RepID=A0AAV8DXU1_9POAL|nr:N-acetyltransferase [Rhynchospora pubera]